ncbi:MAG TPA: hypothetical protein PK911_00245 [Candidatus Saccharibacteria bacterium]|nr:hypothetical protein [Candidatus Saccharibacteria bacterium]
MPIYWYRPALSTAQNEQPNGLTAVENQPVSGSLQKGTPSYKTILPEGKSIDDFGGWTRVSPPNRNPVYAYPDTIGRIPINVSQQPLPDDFAKNDTPEKLKELAIGYAATKRLVAGDTIVYVGTSAKGPQSVIFTKHGLLVLIRASASVPDASWQQYVESLKN